jgi:hypothetical protein
MSLWVSTFEAPVANSTGDQCNKTIMIFHLFSLMFITALTDSYNKLQTIVSDLYEQMQGDTDVTTKEVNMNRRAFTVCSWHTHCRT